MRRAPLLACFATLVTLSAATPATAASSAQDELHACLAHLDASSTLPLLQQCPQVRTALDQLGYTPLLSSGWERHLNGLALQELLDLSQRYRGTAPSAAPSLALLPPVLQQLRGAPSPRSWWQQLEQRLRRWLQGGNAGDAAWLAQLLSAVPPLALRLLFYATLAAVVLLALWIVWRELRDGGWLERPRDVGEQSAIHAVGVRVGTAELTLADLQAAPAGQRAGILLRLLLQAMHRAGRVRGARVLSCRELCERAAFDSTDQRRRFAAIASWAERERYGGEAAAQPAAAPADVEQALAQAGELYAQLLRPVHPAGAATP